MGNALVRAVGSSPGETNRLTFIMYVSAITFSEKSLHLTNAYFVPDDETVKALRDAAEARGRREAPSSRNHRYHPDLECGTVLSIPSC